MTGSKKTTVLQVLSDLQQKMKVSKDRKNDFGGFDYRHVDDILAVLIPLLGEYEQAVTYVISDEIVEIGGRVYVKATGTLSVDGEEHSNYAYARETLDKKKMDEAQLTGSASSYARKYMIQGHFQLQGHSLDADSLNPAEIAGDKRDLFMEKISSGLSSASTVAELNDVAASLKDEAKKLGFVKDLTNAYKLTKAKLEGDEK